MLHASRINCDWALSVIRYWLSVPENNTKDHCELGEISRVIILYYVSPQFYLKYVFVPSVVGAKDFNGNAIFIVCDALHIDSRRILWNRQGFCNGTN